jgi:DNA-binding response OmpR family regulator
LKELWGDDNYFNLRSLNVYITRLRNHLKADPTVEIESVRGVGYLLK